MTHRPCPPLGVPTISRAAIRAHHFKLAAPYDRERARLVLLVYAVRNGRELVFA